MIMLFCVWGNFVVGIEVMTYVFFRSRVMQYLFFSLKLLRRRVSGALCDTCQYVPGIITELDTPLYTYILA